MERIFTSSQNQALLTAPCSCCQNPAPHPGPLLKGEGDTTPHPRRFSQHPLAPTGDVSPSLIFRTGGVWGDQAAAVGSRRSPADLLTLGFRWLQLGETKGTPRARPSRILPQPDSPSLFPIPVLRFLRFPLPGSQIPLQRRCLQPHRRLGSLACG